MWYQEEGGVGGRHDGCIGTDKVDSFQDGHFVGDKDVVAGAVNRSPIIYESLGDYGYIL